MAILELFASLGTFIVEHLGTIILIMVFCGIVTFFVAGIVIEGSQVSQAGIPQNGFNVLKTFTDGFMGVLGLK